MRYAKLIVSVAVLSSILLVSGCFSAVPEDIAAFSRPHEVNVTVDKYLVEPSDQISVICPTIPEISNLGPQMIRPDGKVSFPTIGDVDVAGRTPLEVADAIRAKASKLYNFTGEHPIDVRIAVFQSHVYYVLGQVDRPGPKPFTGRDSALRALAQANLNVMAWGDEIQIIRPSHDPAVKPKVFALKWDPMVAHGDASKDVLLQEGDIIYVPPTVVAAIGLKMEEFLTPIGRAFGTVNVVDDAGNTD